MRHKIDSSMLPFGKPTIIRSPRHLAFVAGHGCAICGRRPVHVHHLTYGWPKARGRKAPDSLTVPLCMAHHQGEDSPHAWGSERRWWAYHERDGLALAAAYWAQSPGNMKATPSPAASPTAGTDQL